MIVFRLDIDLQLDFSDTVCTNNDSFVLPLEDRALLIFLIVNSLFFLSLHQTLTEVILIRICLFKYTSSTACIA